MRFDWFLIKRAIKHFWQRRTRGFDDSETWSLDYTIAKFVLPRLKVFKDGAMCHPYGLTAEEWDDHISKMIVSMEYYANQFERLDIPDQEEYAKIEEGMKLFSEYFGGLWW